MSTVGGDVHKKKKDNVVLPTESVVPHEGQVAAIVKTENVVERKVPPTGGVKAPPPGLTKQPSHTNAVMVSCNCVNVCVCVCARVTLSVHACVRCM